MQADAAFWMRAAQGAIRRECGWHVAPVITETLVIDGAGGRELLVPSLRVIELVSVLNDGDDVTDKVRFSRRAGVLELDAGWSCKVASIEVTMRHGFPANDVPDVAALIVTLTKRASQGAAAGITVQQNIGPAGQRIATGRDGGALGVPLLQSERDTLSPYRLTWGP